MFVKSVLKDSFKELKLVLKDYKLMIVTLITLLINSYFKNSIILRENTGALIIIAILGLFFSVYQYSALGKLISSKDKKIMEGVSKSYWSRFFRLLGTILLILLIFIGLALVLGIILLILQLIISGGNLFSLYYRRGILFSGFLGIFNIIGTLILLFLLARILISIPLSILDDTNRPINLSLEISKGYIFGVFFVNICVNGAGLYTLGIMEKLLSSQSSNAILNSIILMPFNFICSTLIVLFLINSTYYLLNRDKLLKQNKEKSFEEVYNNQ